jgi:sulfatase modifying factor 1
MTRRVRARLICLVVVLASAPAAFAMLADFDHDGDVDLYDYGSFLACFNGPGNPPAEDCTGNADFDADGDVDLADYGAFLACYNGPNNPPACAEPDMVLIPAGEFQMGDTFNDGSSDERPVHAVYVGAFHMGRYPVTNQEYADALNWAYAQTGQITVIGGVVYKYNSGTSYPYCNTTASDPQSGVTWNGSAFGAVSGRENHPMVIVSWYGGAAYANWRSAMNGRPLCYDLSTWACNFSTNGYRLPTEAEREKAARGGVAGHRFPWSDTDTIQHARANYYSSTSYAYDTSPTRGYHPDFDDEGFPGTSPVGYFAPNDYGLYDMAGNVWEWCNDRYSSTYYTSSPYDNPKGPATGGARVLRGGCWPGYASTCRTADRNSYGSPATQYDFYGFRLALNAD